MTVLSHLHVLVVDNEPAILEGMRLLLSGWGCEVWTASNLQGAQEIIRTHKAAPDVIIADYHLDDGDGLDLIRVLRWKTEVATPAILVTADRTPTVRRLGHPHECARAQQTGETGSSQSPSHAVAGDQSCCRISEPVDPQEVSRLTCGR